MPYTYCWRPLCALNVDQGYKIISSLKIDNAVVEMKESAGWRMTLRQGGVGPLVKPPQGAWPSRSGIERCGKDCRTVKSSKVRYGLRR